MTVETEWHWSPTGAKVMRVDDKKIGTLHAVNDGTWTFLSGAPVPFGSPNYRKRYPTHCEHINDAQRYVETLYRMGEIV